MYNKRIVIVLVIILLNTLTINSANAGMLDWVKGFSLVSAGKTIEINNNWSFDKIYNELTKNDQTEKVEITTIQENSLVASAPHITVTSINKPTRKYIVSATAYSSTEAQTDDTPLITASGTYVRDGIIAANFLPFGTRIKIPELYGDKIFIVEDRMNKRYWHRVDIWFPEIEMAREFGIKQISIEIVS